MADWCRRGRFVLLISLPVPLWWIGAGKDEEQEVIQQSITIESRRTQLSLHVLKAGWQQFD
jgi:hypothetical protein